VGPGHVERPLSVADVDHRWMRALFQEDLGSTIQARQAIERMFVESTLVEWARNLVPAADSPVEEQASMNHGVVAACPRA